MKIYPFGAEDTPVLLLLPGTCCHWKSNFGAVIPLLADSFRVLCVSYDGFDETEQTEFSTMIEETQKIEAYLKTHCGGHIRAAGGTAEHPHGLRHSGKLRFGSSIAVGGKIAD